MPKINTTKSKKRHGQHHAQGKHYKSVYWPYIPVLLLIFGGFIFSAIRSPLRSGVLAYATNTTDAGLLTATNKERTKAQRQVLSMNSELDKAAQAKASDMATRGYWSHNTPEGNEPWKFIDETTYLYTKAGENLAYGFISSNETVSGWMNSPSHRANLLDPAFSEVGFGIANAENYQGNEEHSIVVAMYGQPAGGANPALASAEPIEAPPTETSVSSAIDQNQSITRLQAITGGTGPWSVFALGIVSGAAGVGLVASHGIRLRRVIRQSERFILHHPLLDVCLVSLLVLTGFLSQHVGYIN